MCRNTAVAAMLLGVAAMLTDNCARHDVPAGNDLHGAAKAVRMAVVELSDNQEPTTYAAIIAANTQIDLAFRVSGYVVSIRQARAADGRVRPLEPGALVVHGATLARIRAADYQAVVDKARGARDESIAGINATEAQLAEAQAGLAQAESDFRRSAALWQQESITKPAYDASKAKLDVARAKVDAASASVEATRQRTASAAAQLREAEIALGDTELRAPLDGTLVERKVDVGALVTAGTPAFTLADLHLVRARFNVPDTALQHFRNGQSLPTIVDAFPSERFDGRILSIAASADPRARSFEINVAIANPELKLRAGMIASIQVSEGSAARRYPQIPLDALVHDPTADRYLVYTTEQKDGKTVAKAITIRPGPLTGNRVLILDGLRAGERIIVSGANLLRPDDVVQETQ